MATRKKAAVKKALRMGNLGPLPTLAGLAAIKGAVGYSVQIN